MKNLLSIFILSILIFSCGNRKTNKSQTEIKTEATKTLEASTLATFETDKKSETETKKATQENNNIIDEVENLEPINPYKPIVKTTEVKNGKTITTYENAKVDTSKKTDKSEKSTTEDKKEVIVEKEKSDLTNNVKIKEDETTDISQSDKSTERNDISIWWWLLLIIPIAIGIYYYSRRK